MTTPPLPSAATPRALPPPSRRTFLGSVASLLGAGLAWPEELDALAGRLRDARAQDREAYWELVRRQFTIPEDRIYLNNGTLGPVPRPVVRAVEEHERSVAETLPPPTDWEGLKEALGAFLDADPAGFVFPRNTTEAMSFVAHGLELGAGDEVVTTNREHIGGRSCWELLAARRGVHLRFAELPAPATSEQLLDAVWAEVRPRTRVVSVSHVTFTSGTTLPVVELGRRCRERGIVFVVDGAHPPGLMPVRISEIRPDFYASSPHKWLLAPRGTGLLWMDERWRTELWPTLASGGWDDLSLGAHRLNHMGTLDESRLAGLRAAVAFHEALGPERVLARIRELQARLRAGLSSVPGLRFVTPDAPEVSSGMLSFEIAGVPPLELQRRLSAESVRTRVISEFDLGWMRLSTHVYNLPGELDRVVELISEMVRGGEVGA